MGDLTSCPSCDRHVRVSETVCPFCKGKVVARQVGILATAVGAAALLTGCPREPAPVYGGPPPRVQPGPSKAPSATPAPSASPAPIAESRETPDENREVAPASGAPAPR